MSRRRKVPPPRRSRQHPKTGNESAASAAYRAGMAVGYKYRVKGPTFPVTIFGPGDQIHTVDLEVPE